MSLSKVTKSNIINNNNNVKEKEKPEKEAIHSGHFMVSHFEAEAQDDEDDLAVPVPETAEVKTEYNIIKQSTSEEHSKISNRFYVRSQIAIDGSLSKLFECMSLAYRQKLTSPRWNRFRGIRLRWKDKIRLNNVIWRCWHLQFIKRRNTLVCQFASPLDVDTHNKPEAVVLEGKYWKRKLSAVTAEYKRWRMFYRNQVAGTSKDALDMLEMELLAYSQNIDNIDEGMHMMVDEDYMGLMSDTLFSTITNQPFVFPDSREIAKAGLADFIQPSLGPLQPNLNDYMDTFDPFNEMVSSKLPPVPEEQINENLPLYKDSWYLGYQDQQDISTPINVASQNQQGIIQTYNPHNVVSNIDQYQPHLASNNQQQLAASKPNNMQLDMYYHGTAAPGNSTINYNHLMISKHADNSKVAALDSRDLSQQQQHQQPLQQQQHQQQQELKPLAASTFVNNGLMNVNAIDHNLMIGSNRTIAGGSELLQNTSNSLAIPHSFKFSAPTPMSTKGSSLKSSSQTQQEKPISKMKSTRGRPRSRSNTRETIKKPPLISAISDPALINSSNSALLTQLLTNSEASTSFRSNNTNRVLLSMDRKPVRVKEEATPIPILPQPTPATLIITTPVNMTPLQCTNLKIGTEPILLNPIGPSSTNTEVASLSTCLNSPTSSHDSAGSPAREASRDHRRAGHIHAEQKRRYNIKNGFDMIHSLIPHLNQNPNAKLSKAAMLQKGAEYIKQLRAERFILKEEMDKLRQEIETLNTSISNCQPVQVSRVQDNKLQEMFDDYVRKRTLENWKFWIFSLLIQPLLTSFNNFVSTSSVDDLYRTTMQWVEQHCTLVDLRPVVLNSLRYLCTKTDILSEPEKLASEARQIVMSNQKSPPRS